MLDSRCVRSTLAMCLVSFLLGGLCASAETLSYFRHDQGLAADETRLPEKFDSTEQIWKTELPPGISTPCVVGDKIFVTTYEKDKSELATVALDRSSGKVIWKQVAPAKEIEPHHPVGNPASSTPACDGKRLYVFFGSYGLLCYDLDGKLLWKKPMGPFQDEFGASSSPVLVDDKIILNEDHDTNCFIIAIDKATGETAWRTSRAGFTRSYSTPIVWDNGGDKQIIVAGALQLAAYDARDGRKLWWVDGLSRILDSTPVIADGHVFVATWTPGGDTTSRIAMEPYPDALKQFDKNGDGKIAKTELPPGAVLTRFFRIDLDQDEMLNNDEWDKHKRVFALAQNVAISVKPGGSGDVTKTNVKWTYRRGLPTVPSPLVYRDVMYMVKDSGIITSLDAQNGKELKQGRARGRGNYYASPVAGDGKVYLVSERGVITVLKAAGEWEIVSSFDIGQRILATPVIADGKIYVRSDEALYCFAAK